MAKRRNPVEQRKKFLEAYKTKACNISAACNAVKISRDTYYRWMKLKSFEKQVIEAQEQFEDWYEAKVIQTMRDDPVTLRWYGERKMRHKGYGNKDEIEHSGEFPSFTVNIKTDNNEK